MTAESLGTFTLSEQKYDDKDSEIYRALAGHGDMFRIIRIEIDREALIDAGKSSRSAVERISDLGDIISSNGVFATKAMATTSGDYYEIEAALRSLFGYCDKWKVIDYSSQYTLVRTRAPKDYDYGYCVEVGYLADAGETQEERLIAVPADKVEYQSGRYSSGMFMPTVCS